MAQMNLSTEQKQTHGHREQMCDGQVGWRGSGMDWEFGVDRCKLLHLEWISNEVLLYRQHRELYPISCDRTWWKIVWEKECVCVYICIYTHIHIHTYIYKYDWINFAAETDTRLNQLTITKKILNDEFYIVWIFFKYKTFQEVLKIEKRERSLKKGETGSSHRGSVVNKSN